MIRARTARTIIFVLLMSTLACLAEPGGNPFISRLLQIADPDQIRAYQQMDLSGKQTEEIQQILQSYIPRLPKKKTPGSMLPLLPEVMKEIDTVLTPKQRPLARKLLPRPHQWQPLAALFADYRSRS